MRTLIFSAMMALGLSGQVYAQEALVVGTDVDAGTLDSRLARDTTAVRTSDLIYSGLVRLAPDLKPVPELAESWESTDPKTYIFKLRKGLKFSNDLPLTADDVVYTYQTILKEDFGSALRALYTPIASVEKIDDVTVKFNLRTPYAPLLSYLDLGIVPKTLVEAGHDLATQPVGAGPMKLSAWNRGAEIKLEANAKYWAGAPAVGKVTIKVIGDNTARAQAFEAGELDAIQSPLSPQDIARLSADTRFGSYIVPGLGVNFLHFNLKDPILADVKVRQAVSKLIDQATIVNDIYQGVDAVASSIILPSSWAYSPDIKQPVFDVAGAAALLDDAGWKDTNADGIRDKDGKPLSLVLSTHAEDVNRVQAIEFIQAVMIEAGIDAKTKIADWPTFSTNYVFKSQHQIALMGWTNIVDPDRLMFSQLSTGGSLNWGGYSNPRIDELLTKGRTLLDQADRTATYQEAAKILAEELPFFVISVQGYQLFYNKSLEGKVEATPRGTLRGLIGLQR